MKRTTRDRKGAHRMYSVTETHLGAAVSSEKQWEPWSQHSSLTHPGKVESDAVLTSVLSFTLGFWSQCVTLVGDFLHYFCSQLGNFIWPYGESSLPQRLWKSQKQNKPKPKSNRNQKPKTKTNKTNQNKTLLASPRVILAHLSLSKLRNNRFGNSSDYKLPPICTLQDIAHRKQKPNNRVSLPKTTLWSYIEML